MLQDITQCVSGNYCQDYKFNIFTSLTDKISQYQPNKLQGVIPHMTVISIQLVPEYQQYFVLTCILIPGLYSVFSDTYICYTK